MGNVLDLTADKDIDLAQVDFSKVDQVVIPVIPVIYLSGMLETEFNGSLKGHRYAASPFLNIEKYEEIISAACTPACIDPEALIQGFSQILNDHLSPDQLDAINKSVADDDASCVYVGKIVGLAVRVESPGGSPSESYALAELIRRKAGKAKIPVYTFTQNVAASGGYFLLSAGDHMYAEPFADVGSIGVVSHRRWLDWLGRLLNRVKFEFLTSGENKRSSVDNPYVAHKKEDIEERLSELAECHEMFKSYVKSRRGDKVTNEGEAFSGKCFSAKKALELGLIDGLGNWEDILETEFGTKILTMELDVMDLALVEQGIDLASVMASQSAKASKEARLMSAGYVPRMQAKYFSHGKIELK